VRGSDQRHNHDPCKTHAGACGGLIMTCEHLRRGCPAYLRSLLSLHELPRGHSGRGVSQRQIPNVLQTLSSLFPSPQIPTYPHHSDESLIISPRFRVHSSSKSIGPNAQRTQSKVSFMTLDLQLSQPCSIGSGCFQDRRTPDCVEFSDQRSQPAPVPRQGSFEYARRLIALPYYSTPSLRRPVLHTPAS
jgi:hypothetical protein